MSFVCSTIRILCTSNFQNVGARATAQAKTKSGCDEELQSGNSTHTAQCFIHKSVIIQEGTEISQTGQEKTIVMCAQQVNDVAEHVFVKHRVF